MSINKQAQIFQISTSRSKCQAAFVKSPFRYPGGKFYALKHILPFITGVPHDEYREPFLGGGNVFFAKPKSLYNWLNDLNSELMNIYRIIADKASRKKLVKRLLNEIATRERHEQIKNLVTNTPLDAAFKTYYLIRTSYSGIINRPAWGYEDGKSVAPKSWGRLIEAASRKLEEVMLTNLDFEEVINSEAVGKRVLMYLDPPYYHADQKRAYDKYFNIKDHERLASLLFKTEHLFCLSYDDCLEIRKLYSWAHIYEKSWLYNTANLKGNGSRIIGRELIITNYEVIQPVQMVLTEV